MFYMHRVLVAIFVINHLSQSLAAPPDIHPFRIIGGSRCEPRDYPFAVAIVGSHLCGGSLLTLEWVLTAAHCIDPEELDVASSKVRSGFNAPPHLIQERGVSRLVSHPKYNHTLLNAGIEIRYDIGFILIDKPFRPSSVTKTALLPSSGFSSNCTYGLALGVGKTSNDEVITDNIGERPLICVTLEFVNPLSFCALTFGQAVIDNTILCTKTPPGQSSKDTCMGDSGGPLICNNRLVGVISYGPILCGTTGSASNMKIESYMDFINKVIKSRVSPRGGGPAWATASSTNRLRPSVSKSSLLLFTVFYHIVFGHQRVTDLF